jgi:hypothetical protein
MRPALHPPTPALLTISPPTHTLHYHYQHTPCENAHRITQLPLLAANLLASPGCTSCVNTHRTPLGAACGCGCSPCSRMLLPACCSPTLRPCSASAAPWASLEGCRCCQCPQQHSQVRDVGLRAGLFGLRCDVGRQFSHPVLCSCCA